MYAKFFIKFELQQQQITSIIQNIYYCILKWSLNFKLGYPLIFLYYQEIQLRQCPNLKMKSSSSSSGSLKLIPDTELELKYHRHTPSKDLFDLLIDQAQISKDDQILRTIKSLNLSPRQQSTQGCKCSKIDCLKMYCECFSKGQLCNQKCICNNCCNKHDCQIEIYKARQLANFRHPGTFKGIPALVPLKRCTCKKSECRKNYCQCFRAGEKCTQECECLDCQNGKIHKHDDYFDSRMEIQVQA